ncbi:hypothetical protein SLEP1_g40268 [Rubroshorea leprosula]|uniref:Protein kinase domain-containing protein n=1 Tax=Rubroshorea leprosula TaxID=152421 RepID=A0AAV5L2W1_9ROSI|nr:hypothetical protein SLEP1_g40268 [Rubroshorea leprosula]
MENAQLQGEVPVDLFNLPNLQTVGLKHNGLTSALSIGMEFSNQLSLIDLQNNEITEFNGTEGNNIQISYLLLHLSIFPYGQDRFNRTGISTIAFIFSNQSYKPPSNLDGPYFFLAPKISKKSTIGIIIRAAIGGFVLLLLSLLAGVYAFHQKKKAERVSLESKPFAHWDVKKSNRSIPQLKVSSCFSFEELKKYTNNFSKVNDIGFGDYGKRLTAKVADFGLSKLISDSEKGHVTTQVKGTMQLTEKSDVYSFGVLLLELVIGRRPIERGKYIVREVRMAMNKTKGLYSFHQILDPAIADTSLKGLEKFVDLAMSCVEELGVDRPTMGEVVKEIENIMQIAEMNPNAESAKSSSSYEEASKGSTLHPYSDESFAYSGTFLV